MSRAPFIYVFTGMLSETGFGIFFCHIPDDTLEILAFNLENISECIGVFLKNRKFNIDPVKQGFVSIKLFFSYFLYKICVFGCSKELYHCDWFLLLYLGFLLY